MATFLFGEIIFGPVKSRRLGISLGINLLPEGRKICNFDCIYCECGWSDSLETSSQKFPMREDVQTALANRLRSMHEGGAPLDTITFAGNGEPTLHPEFPGIIDDSIALRNQYFPQVEIAVLSNATTIIKPEIFTALSRVAHNILKIDSAFEETIQALNQPRGTYSLKEIVTNLEQFQGQFTLQTLFVTGSRNGIAINNASDKEVNAWLKLVKKLNPKRVMVYTIARDTPIDSLQKVAPERLDAIAAEVRKLGISVAVSY